MGGGEGVSEWRPRNAAGGTHGSELQHTPVISEEMEWPERLVQCMQVKLRLVLSIHLFIYSTNKPNASPNLDRDTVVKKKKKTLKPPSSQSLHSDGGV